MRQAFRRFAEKTAEVIGSPWTFLVAVALIVICGTSGALLGFTSFWHLLLDAMTILTFLMLFLLQNSQNRHAKATHLKLNELIRAVEGAHTHLVNLENLSDEQIERLERAFLRLRERHSGTSEQALEAVVQKLDEQAA